MKCPFRRQRLLLRVTVAVEKSLKEGNRANRRINDKQKENELKERDLTLVIRLRSPLIDSDEVNLQILRGAIRMAWYQERCT